eukprot:CAMPEP_0206430020 /NCGR_PEP_ID=MMETSP0324_2-20121206/6574_1 /ASSEMBLY_ACC=CAM_ASM_000836 /TAXON_ID=2866 /ORGANISM="Crypthecodinium cohnii, Strain Seligo" /LENGTH=1105 /DNA_ID=CAMNT_0053895785 /DNA_START=60 /DNA_END=3378 /DNA_ORIENTATION=+
MDFDLCYSRGIVTIAGSAVDATATAGLPSVPSDWQSARQKRDGDHFHITFLNKADLQLIAEGIQKGSLPVLTPTDPTEIASVATAIIQHMKSLPGALSWVDLGEGRVSADGGEAAFRVVLWPGGTYLRRLAGLPHLDFHLTLGFLSHDVHGKCKGPSSLVAGVPAAASLPHLLKLSQTLLQAEPVQGFTDEGARITAEIALEVAREHQNQEHEQAALEVCCQLAGRAKYIEGLEEYGRDLLLIAPANPIALRSAAFAALSRSRFEAALPLLKVLKGVVEDAKQSGKAQTAEGIEKWVEASIQKCKTKLGLPDEDPIFPGPEDRCTANWDQAFEDAFVGHSNTKSKAEQVQLKFPSTAHLKNLGAATKDDKLCNPERVKTFCGSGKKIFVEEKIDGANLGISLDSNFQWRMQGRGKWVNWNTDPQFAGLQEWLQEHSATLAELLERNNDILFGEWCAARHTVKYNGLPGYFLVRHLRLEEGKVLESEVLPHAPRELRKGPQIPAVPMLAQARAFASVEEVENLLKLKSTFADEAVEGVYLRIDEDDSKQHPSKETYLEDRCKLVRSEFQQAIESHGTWRGSGRNGLNMELSMTYAASSYPCAVLTTSSSSDAASKDAVEEIPTTLTDPRQKQTVHVKDLGPVELPRNFSFLAEDLAVSSEPKNRNQILAMASLGISLVVTLTEESPLPADFFVDSGVRNLFVPVPNYYPPSAEQTDSIAEKVLATTSSQNQKVMVHCGGGKGRAGTVAACLLAKFGYERIGAGEGLQSDTPPTSSELIRYLRERRPGSIETERQEQFLKQYISEMWKAPQATPEAPKVNPSKKLPKLVMMVGLIGSGKSTFAKVLESAAGYVRINQDEQGRSGCEEALQKALKNSKKGDVRMVLDRCNLTKDERKQWREACGNPKSEDIVCIFFNFNLEACKIQAAARTNHPTIKQGGGARILDEEAKLLQPPDASEKFGKLIEVKTYSEASNVLKTLGLDEATAKSYFASSSSSSSSAPIKDKSESGGDGDAEGDADEGPQAGVPTKEEPSSSSSLPDEFQRWLKLALEEELGRDDGESIFAALEMILENAQEDPDALSSCIEVLTDSGAPLCAAKIEDKWKMLA